MRSKRSLAAVLGLAAAISLGAAACGDGDDDATSTAAPSPTSEELAPGETSGTSEEMTAEEMTPSTMAESDGASASGMLTPFGPACSAVPADGAGSFAGMAQDPAATAASNNPVLSTLVSAVSAAGLVDTLNGPGPFTIFAPANDAFAKVDQATLDALLADPAGDLTKVLTYHVVAGQKLDADALVSMGAVETVEGDAVTVTREGETLKVNGSTSVVCGNIDTANASVFIIDGVLQPMS